MNVIKKYLNSTNLYIFFILILCIAIIPRSIELFNKNYLWGFDQGEHYLAVKDIVIDRDLTLIGTKVGGAGGFFQGPGWYYLLSIPFFISKGDPYSGMVLMFIIGISTVALSFFFTKRMFGEITALIVSLLIAVSPAIIPQSRFIWPPFPISLLTVCFLYALYLTLEGKKHFLPVVTAIVGLMAHFEIATAGTLIFQFALFSPVLFWKRLISLKYLLISIVTFILTLSPLIVFDFRNDHLIFKGIINLISGTTSINPGFIWTFNNHLTVFKNNFVATFYGGNKLSWLYYFIFIVGGILYLRDKKNHIPNKLFVFYLLTSPFLLFIVFLKYSQGMWDWWLLQMPIIYCFLFGIIFRYFFKNKIIRWLVAIMLVYFMLAYSRQSYLWFRNDFYDYGGTHKIKGKLDALDYIYKDAKGKPFGLFIFTPPVYTYAYDYLVWWYGQNKYGYIPTDKKEDLFYLLIEIDPSKPWTYKGWLDTVIKDGSVTDSITLPNSGFLIQRRVKEK